MDPSTWNCQPVFICGYPKSGTTLLLALLDSHPELLVFPEETRFFQRVLGHPERCNPDFLFSETAVSVLGLGKVSMPSGARDYSDIDYRKYQDGLRAHWQAGNKNQQALFEAIFHAYALVKDQFDSKYCVEKTPFNERYLNRAAQMWPDLRAIYIARDPRDNYCSYRKQRERQVAASDGKDGLSLLSKEEFIAYWLDSLLYWERFSAQHKNQVLMLRYEDLVQKPDKELRHLCDFLGIEWHPGLLIPTRNNQPWSGNSIYGTQHSGISTSSVGRYRERLYEDEIIFLESWLGKMMRRYAWGFDFAPRNAVKKIVKLIGNRSIKPFIKAKLVLNWIRYQLT
jgi:hypothetical protein